MKKKTSKTKPTAEQIAAEAEKLRKMKPRVRMTSAFGDNHWDAIDAQIEVLTKNLSHTDIDNRTPCEDEEDYEERIEAGDWPTNVGDAARSCREWMDGEEKKSPSQEWKELVVK